MIKKRIRRIIKIAIFGIIGVAVFGTLVMQLWNRFSGLVRLAHHRLLAGIGAFDSQPDFLWRVPRPLGMGRRRLMDRWEKMPPEEREKLREGLRGRCGKFEAPSAEPQAS